MLLFIALLAVYGVVFLLQEKAEFHKGIHPLLDRVLECEFCLGFWVAWLGWGITSTLYSIPIIAGLGMVGVFLAGLAWAFAAAAFVYILGALVFWVENS